MTIRSTMRALVVLACVALSNCTARVGPAVKTTSGQGLQSQQTASSIFGIIGSPVGAGSFGQAPLSILPANFFSSLNKASKPQPLGHFQPFLHQPVVPPQTAAPKTASPPKRHALQDAAAPAPAPAAAPAPAPAIAESRSL